MNANHILCPIDFSEASEAALEVASKLARDNDAKLHLVHVEEDPAVVHPGLFPALTPATWKEKHRLTSILPTATEVEFQHDLLVGDPVHQIVNFAERNEIDLIVMGTHGLSGLARLLMGSVAEGVVRLATVPVLTMKPRVLTLAATD